MSQNGGSNSNEGTTVTSAVVQPEAGDADAPASEDQPATRLRESPIHKVMEQLVAEADKLAGGIREDAAREAQAQAAKIRADAEAKAREEILEPARAAADEKARAIVAEAEGQAQDVVGKARAEAEEILQAAKKTAGDLDAEAAARVRGLAEKITGEVESAVSSLDDIITVMAESARGTDQESDPGADESESPS